MGDQPRKNLVFVNQEKRERAEVIIELILGETPPKDHLEEQRKDHYARQLNARGIDPASPDALYEVYKLLGGLLRTPEEQRKAERAKEEARAKAKRRMIE